MLYIIAGIGILLAFGSIIAGVIMARRGDTVALERLDQYVGGGTLAADEEPARKKTEKPATSALTDTLDRAIRARGLGKGIAAELSRADLKITVAEFWAMTLISIILTTAVVWLIYGGWLFPLMGVVAGFFLPRIYVKWRQRSRLKQFNDQLGDGIQLMANGLRAGYSLLQAMDAVANEMPPPIGLEFGRVVREIGLGVDNERAFENLLRRVPSDDLDLMVTAINVQAEVGGNLAEILEIIGEVIRERVRIKGEIRVLTAQAQLSGYVISALPIILGLILYAMNPDYIGRMVYSCEARGLGPDDLCSQPCGWIMVGVGLLGISAGFYAMRKITDIEV
ncbi:MAG: secretion system protein [Chloroflexi bacterium]|nr:MAG: secretion system protein [Chloroflexota bacterium]